MSAALSVLLVEDNPADVFLMARAFEEALEGARLYQARDAEQAMQLLYVKLLDLVLLDLSLPGLGGLDVLAEVKRMPQHRELPVVVLTSSSDEADRHASLALGAEWFVTKPTTFDDLLALVRALRNLTQRTA